MSTEHHRRAVDALAAVQGAESMLTGCPAEDLARRQGMLDRARDKAAEAMRAALIADGVAMDPTDPADWRTPTADEARAFRRLVDDGQERRREFERRTLPMRVWP